MKTETNTYSYTISKQNVESAILHFLFQMNIIPKNIDILDLALDTRVRDGQMTVKINCMEVPSE